jgi:hypothetical protein
MHWLYNWAILLHGPACSWELAGVKGTRKRSKCSFALLLGYLTYLLRVLILSVSQVAGRRYKAELNQLESDIAWHRFYAVPGARLGTDKTYFLSDDFCT